MPKGIPNAKTVKTGNSSTDANDLKNRLKPTTLNHIYYFDSQGDGRYREVAIVKQDQNPNGTIRSIYYIDIALLDNVDKGRLKSIVSNRHADKYPLWDLMSQSQLSNGKNALDYFHQMTKVEHGVGAVNTGFGGGLAGVAVENNSIIGSEFSDPTSASLETQGA